MFEIRSGEDGMVWFTGRLDASQADRALEVLSTFEGPLTADCSELDYVSSAGLSVIFQTWQRLHAAGHSFKLVNLPPRVRNVFAYAGFDRFLEIG